MGPRGDGILLFDILECCRRIESYIASINKAEFENSYQLQDALIRNLEVIGEAAKGLSQQIAEQDPEIPWAQMAGMRDRIVHQYFRVDLEVVWKTVTVDIPVLEKRVQEIYDRFASVEWDG